MDYLEALIDFPELDGIVIGPHDLSTNYEMPEEYTSSDFNALVTDIIKRARAAGKCAGIHMTWPTGTDQEIEWCMNGANIVIHKADIILFKQCLTAEIQELRGALGDDLSVNRGNVNI